ncbi:MAG: PGPGW domain-containing protein [Candidatus Woesearchaeota archaeon]
MKKVRPIKIIKRVGITIIGITIILFGLILTVTPGPAIVVIPIGIMILASEYVLIRNLIYKFKYGLEKKGYEGRITRYLGEALRRMEK